MLTCLTTYNSYCSFTALLHYCSAYQPTTFNDSRQIISNARETILCDDFNLIIMIMMLFRTLDATISAIETKQNHNNIRACGRWTTAGASRNYLNGRSRL